MLVRRIERSAASGLVAPDSPDCMANDMSKRLYPWGTEFHPSRANCRETEIELTSAVGCFPGGLSPCGAYDMAGNVWEWTRSLWGEDLQKASFGYPYKPDDGRENLDAPANVTRVLRGGSWLFPAVGARCAARGGDFPGGRDGDIGFRVVASPFSER
jgi:formylglycine-generating enzyme required for sulfatase activity